MPVEVIPPRQGGGGFGPRGVTVPWDAQLALIDGPIGVLVI